MSSRGRLGGLLAALLAALLAPSVGCDQDGPILWADGAGDTIDTGTGGGTVTGTGTGADPTEGLRHVSPWTRPPPPPPLECPSPQEPVCFCPPAASCICGPPPAPPPGPCELICEGDGCELACLVDFCTMSCGFGCTVVCDPFTSCSVSCDGDCMVLCQEGATCTVWSSPGTSQLFCDVGAICECAIPGGCICDGPGCPP